MIALIESITVYPFTRRRVFSFGVRSFPSIFRRKSAARMPATLEKAEVVLERLDGSLRRVDRTLTGGGAQAEETLENLRVMTQDLRELSGTLKRYPAHAVFGEAPPKSKAVER